MSKDSRKLLFDVISAGLGGVKKLLSEGAAEGTKAGKIVADKVLYSVDLSTDDIKKELKVIQKELSGIMGEASKDSIQIYLRNLSRESQISLVERLSAENQKKIAELSNEMLAIINDCRAQINEREKMIFPKVRTVAELAEVCKKLKLDFDFHMLSPKAVVYGKVSGKKVAFYLEAGDYDGGVGIYTIPYDLLCKN